MLAEGYTLHAQKQPSINCKCFYHGKCLHQAAPRAFFGKAKCILEDQPDIRINSCSLLVQHEKPAYPAPPPPRNLKGVQS